MNFIAAWTATIEAFTKVFAWKTGGRTKDENSLRSQIEETQRAYDNEIRKAGSVDSINGLYLRLRRLRDEARAKRGG